jgi:Fic family protein
MARQGAYVKQLEGYKAFIPSPLPPHPALKLSDELLAKHEQVMRSLARLDGLAYMLPNLDLFIAMYVKKEALLSSQIEGTQVSLENIFEYESGVAIEHMSDMKEVVNYIKALNYGLKRLEKIPMSLRLIKELHEIILSHTRGKQKTPGEFKRSQNWIGGEFSSLKNALFIPPPPAQAMSAMADLENYLHLQSPYPEIINCALIHYQFETIHPFLDGNGRIGRLLITFYLVWKGIIEKPILYSSYYFKKNRQEYYDRLMMVRNTGDYEQWVNFFLNGILEASDSAIEETKKILQLQSTDQQKLADKKIASPLAIPLLNQLMRTPVVSISDIQQQLSISYPTAAQLVKKFVKLEILKETTGKKRSQRFAYHHYLKILAEGTNPLS